jgi:hypothetical protein
MITGMLAEGLADMFKRVPSMCLQAACINVDSNSSRACLGVGMSKQKVLHKTGGADWGLQ